MLEGPDLVVAALEAQHPVEAVYFEAAALAHERSAAALALAARSGVRVVELAAGVLQKVSDAVTPQPVSAVASRVEVAIDELAAGGVVLVLDDVRDPGNLGTAIRAADAAGAAGVVVTGQSVDVDNPKALRATAGSAFHVPICVVGALEEAVGVLRTQGRAVLGAVVHGGAPLFSAPLPTPAAVVVGGEARGLDPALVATLDGAVTIEMAGRAESLNVGVAAALVCFEWQRRVSDAPRAPAPTI